MLIAMCVFGLMGSWTFYFGWKKWNDNTPKLASIFRYGVLGIVVGSLLWVRTAGGAELDHFTAAERAFAWGCIAEYVAAMIRANVENRMGPAPQDKKAEPSEAGPIFAKGAYSAKYRPKNIHRRPRINNRISRDRTT